MTSNTQQRGSTLMVALIMLALLTLIALSAMKGTTSSIQVVGNAQFREEAKAAAQQAIERVISNGNFRTSLTPPATQSIDVNRDGNPDYTVAFDKPQCLSANKATVGQAGVPAVCAGSSGGADLCVWALWDIVARVSDIQTGAAVVLHQGVRTITGINDAVNQGC